MAVLLISSLASGLNFEARNGKLLLDGQPFFVKGINWYGTEHKLDHTLFGLDVHSLDYYFALLQEEGFNAVVSCSATHCPRPAH